MKLVSHSFSCAAIAPADTLLDSNLNLHKNEKVNEGTRATRSPPQGPHARVSRRGAAQTGNEPISSVMCVFFSAVALRVLLEQKKKTSSE